jgi:hypothetical protein
MAFLGDPPRGTVPPIEPTVELAQQKYEAYEAEVPNKNRIMFAGAQ